MPRKVKGTFARARFTKDDIPPLSFWKDAVRQVPELTPQECDRVANTYVRLAVADRPGWREKLGEDYATLHHLAILLMNGPPGPGFHIALHIYYTLTMLDYAPSILTLVRLARTRQKLGESQFQLAEDKFAALARRRDDPNACTLQGLLLTAQLTPAADAEALEWFRTAALLGGEVPGAWEWQLTCALEMGKAHLRLGNRERAKAIWGYCAKELDSAEGCWLYCSVLDESDPERYDWVCKAAISGVKDAAEEMARLQGLAARNPPEGASEWDKKAAAVMQKEWETIAGVRPAP
jgi:hypothetical protein